MLSVRTVVLEVAYTDLVSSQVNLVSTGGTYNYAVDTPISADGSPHITHLGYQFTFNFGAANPVATSTLSNLVSGIRLKVGSTEVMNYDQTYSAVAAADVGQIGVLAQKVGGIDTITEYVNAAGENCITGELSFPVGLPAGRSHRVNVQISLGDETLWCGAAFTPGSSEHNLCLNYGTSTEATLYGSRQDFTLTANATRSIVIYGKENWSMLGMLSQSSSANDRITEIRVRNGAFRSLTLSQWRIINGTAWRSPLRLVQSTIGQPPVWSTGQPGSLFVDLRRLTAGASAEMLVSCGATGETHTFFPVWVAPISQKTSKAPRQTAKTVDSTTKAVLNEGTY